MLDLLVLCTKGPDKFSFAPTVVHWRRRLQRIWLQRKCNVRSLYDSGCQVGYAPELRFYHILSHTLVMEQLHVLSRAIRRTKPSDERTTTFAVVQSSILAGAEWERESEVWAGS